MLQIDVERNPLQLDSHRAQNLKLHSPNLADTAAGTKFDTSADMLPKKDHRFRLVPLPPADAQRARRLGAAYALGKKTL